MFIVVLDEILLNLPDDIKNHVNLNVGVGVGDVAAANKINRSEIPSANLPDDIGRDVRSQVRQR